MMENGRSSDDLEWGEERWEAERKRGWRMEVRMRALEWNNGRPVKSRDLEWRKAERERGWSKE